MVNDVKDETRCHATQGLHAQMMRWMCLSLLLLMVMNEWTHRHLDFYALHVVLCAFSSATPSQCFWPLSVVVGLHRPLPEAS